MSTSSSNLTRHRSLAHEIMEAFANISSEYSSFQNKNSLSCAAGCGKCCFKSDIYCAPIELLPLALDLIDRGEAESVLEKCIKHEADHCMFMNISDLKAGKGQCTEYTFRPLVCRTFGVAGKHDKDGKVSFSVCTTLKETNAKNYTELLNKKNDNSDIPFIDKAKNKLTCLDPRFLEKEFPINQALAMLLDKLLLEHSFQSHT